MAVESDNPRRFYLGAVEKYLYSDDLGMALLNVQYGDFTIEELRESISRHLRTQAAIDARISKTPGYRFTEGRTAGFYAYEAERENNLADTVESGAEVMVNGRLIPASPKLLEQTPKNPY